MLSRSSRSRSRTTDTPTSTSAAALLGLTKLEPPSPISPSSQSQINMAASSNALAVLADAANEMEPDDATNHSSSLSEIDDDVSDIIPYGSQDDLPIKRSIRDVDSETETERLHISPHKVQEENGLDNSSIVDGLSPKSEGRFSIMPTERLSLGKRKRLQPISDTSEIQDDEADDEDDEPTPKRALTDEAQIDLIEEQLANEENAAIDAERHIEEPVIADLAPERPTSPKSRRPINRKGRRKVGKAQAIHDQEAAAEVSDTPIVEAEEEEVEEEDDSPPDEEVAKRKVAASMFITIEKDFASFRARSVQEQLEQVEYELQLLKQADCTHTDYLAQLRCINERRDQKLRFEDRLLEYSLANTAMRSVAERQQVFSQYFQQVRDLRCGAIREAYREIYTLQRDRWQHGLKDEALALYKPNRGDQILRQTSYNLEVSLLSGISAYVGFPAAPELGTIAQIDILQDMQSFGIPPEQQRTASISRREPLSAEEQFLQQTPWANPRHPSLTNASIQSFHTQNSQTSQTAHTAQASHTLNTSNTAQASQSQFTTPAFIKTNNEIPLSHGSASTIDLPVSGNFTVSQVPQDYSESPSAGIKVNKSRNNHHHNHHHNNNNSNSNTNTANNANQASNTTEMPSFHQAKRLNYSSSSNRNPEIVGPAPQRAILTGGRLGI